MTPERKEELKNKMTEFADEFLGKYEEFLCYLKGRWEDEKEYEDWKDYEKAIKEKITDYTIIKVLKVGVVIRTEEFDIEIKVNMTQIKYKIIKVH